MVAGWRRTGIQLLLNDAIKVGKMSRDDARS